MSLILEQNNNVFKTKFTPAGIFITLMLGLALLALGERILYDATRLIIGTEYIDYFNNIGVILVHAVITIFFLIVALSATMMLGSRKEAYAVALVPYYTVTIILVLQLLLQISVYFANHHTPAQFYLVMSALVAICTYGIYFIQSHYHNSQA